MAGNISEERLAELLDRHTKNLMHSLGNDESKRDDEILQDSSKTFLSFLWGGQFHNVPEGFRLPACDITQAHRLWHLGNSTLGVRPYKHIESRDFTTKTFKNELVEWRKVMKMIDQIAKEEAPDIYNANPKNEAELIPIISVASPPLQEQYNRARKRQRTDNRNTVLSILTIASRINKTPRQ
jgi:hypothetical protein